jgi:glycine cleavage system H protein
MEKIPSELKYTKTHEWIRLEDDGTAVVGITDHAQTLLGDLVYVELPEVALIAAAAEEVAVVESVKAASDIYIPVTGEVVAINEQLESAPELINTDPYGEGWLFKIMLSDEGEIDALLDSKEYAELVECDDNC